MRRRSASQEESMDQKTISRLLIIASLGLSAAGIIFLVLSLLKVWEGNTALTLALGCIVLGNLFNVLQIQRRKKEK